MWSSLPVLLFVSGMSLADEYLAVSAHKGAPLRSRRMVRGSIAQNIPWQALLHFGENVLDGGIGGGALVSERWVLTSGRNLFLNKSRQAAKRQPLTIPKVYLGITQRNPVDPSKEVAVEKVVLHPDFQNNSTWDNNLALIKLKEAVVYSETVMPIPLPMVGQDLEEQEGAQGVVTGWGWGTFFTFSNNLKYLILPVADRGLCRAEYSHGGQVLIDTPQVDNRTFCTGASPYQENVCFGDEGAALVFMDPTDSQVYAAGILSFDKTCGVEKYAVYTKLSAYMPWINSVMREDSDRFSALRTSIMAHIYSKQ
ncbi:hypothetical protein AAFF_G00226260 [Aldrovandia affinis]|uniref:Peptidase S1 domain-containing protein n=1 Tax=Aldrovandia affinis TaxID=143900 RepID=A0AAD7TCH6_9TELE|nr:hypothetical protein AAFF_G00226260 [Aldrovandia affinis]